jgi:hypothetical protein
MCTEPCSINPKGKTWLKKTFQATPLALETRAALPTTEAAFHLNRAEQTLRLWAMQK